MRLKIVGSGGMFQIPNPFCKCPICEEARTKRGKYERLGPSIYIEDIQMLIDTPEDIGVACDRQGISEIKYLSISHKDPDHTRGMRIVEPLGYDCIADRGTSIQFIALPEVVDDIKHGTETDYIITRIFFIVFPSLKRIISKLEISKFT